MYIPYFTPRRRRSILGAPMPESQQAALEENVAAYRSMPPEQRSTLRDMARVLLKEKVWEGCGGLKLSDEMKIVIAAQASLLLVGHGVDLLRDDLYPQCQSVLVYPDAYASSQPARAVAPIGAMNIMTDQASTNLGEAWQNGPVILSWAAALAGARGLTPGHDVTLHEFAHKLDMLDGTIDGTPPLATPAFGEHWKLTMTGEFNRLARATATGTPHALSTYALHSPGEFFAVATESFFTRSTTMQELHPELYQTMQTYYNQDPASWSLRGESTNGGTKPGHGSLGVEHWA